MIDPNTRFGPYRIIRPLGKGGMAEVYEVENEKLGSRYAMKVFTLDHGDVEFLKKRFQVEGRLLARLDHPRIVRVYDMDVDAATGLPYYVMDLVLNPSGSPQSLQEALTAGDITEENVANWYEDLREGLAYIHGEGVVHRDVTLENVLIGADGRAVLSDFGVSKILPRDLRSELKETMNTLVRGEKPLMGKPFYIAPEVRKGADESAASDYYSLGVMLLRLLTRVWYAPGAKLEELLLPLDPRWRIIIPGLLAEKPTDRVCKRWDCGRKHLRVIAGEAKLNEMYVRIRFPHWIIGSAMIIAVVAYAGLVLFAAYQHGKLKMAEREIERLNQVLRSAQ